MGSTHRPGASIGAGILLVVLAAALATGCGSSGGDSSIAAPEPGAAPRGAAARSCSVAVAGIASVRAGGIACATAAQVIAGWASNGECGGRSGASRSSCSIGGYRCLGASTERGLAVSCARSGRSISFVASGSYN